jgi:hypothetical protein
MFPLKTVTFKVTPEEHAHLVAVVNDVNTGELPLEEKIVTEGIREELQAAVTRRQIWCELRNSNGDVSLKLTPEEFRHLGNFMPVGNEKERGG